MQEPNLSIILYSAAPRNSKNSQRYTTRWKPQSSYGQNSFVCKIKAERARLQQQPVRHHEGRMVGGQETLCPMFQTSNLQNTCNFKKHKDIQEKTHNAEKSFLCFKAEF
jgi:hypothetical protein